MLRWSSHDRCHSATVTGTGRIYPRSAMNQCHQARRPSGRSSSHRTRAEPGRSSAFSSAFRLFFCALWQVLESLCCFILPRCLSTCPQRSQTKPLCSALSSCPSAAPSLQSELNGVPAITSADSFAPSASSASESMRYSPHCPKARDSKWCFARHSVRAKTHVFNRGHG